MSYIKPIDFIKFCVSNGLELNVGTLENNEITDSIIVNQDNIDEFEKRISEKGNNFNHIYPHK